MPKKAKKPTPTPAEIDNILGRNAKQKTIYEKSLTRMDATTGEIIDEEIARVKTTTKEPDFVKIYYGSMLAFQNVDGIPIDFLCEMSRYLTYANNAKEQMIVNLGKFQRKQIADALGRSLPMVDKYIHKCVESGVLFKTGYRGTYAANPFLIARGEWKDIKELRACFDYRNGSWAYNRLTDVSDDGKYVASTTVTSITENEKQKPRYEVKQIEFTDEASFNALVEDMKHVKANTD